MSKLTQQSNGIAISALNLQNLLWKHDGRTIDEYLKIPSNLATLQSEFLVIGIFTVICLVLMLGLLLSACATCICRLGCNKCGGRKPMPEGYSSLSAMIISIIITVTALVFGIFGGFLVMFSDQFGVGIISSGPASLNLISQVRSFQDGLNSNLTHIPSLVQQGVDAMKADIIGYNWTSSIDSNLLNPVMDNLTNITFAMDANIRKMKVNMNNTANLNDNVHALVNNITLDISWISEVINSYSVVSIAGVDYYLSDTPSLNQLNSVELPDMSKTPNVTKLQSDVNGIPNVISKLDSVTSEFVSIGDTLSSTLNITLNVMIPSNIGSTLNFGNKIEIVPTGTIKSTEKMIGNLLKQIKSGDEIRNDVYRAFYAFSMLPWLLALAGIVLRKRNFIKPLTIIIVFVGLIYWLQFFIFFILSIPFNDICKSYSKGVIFSTNLALMNKSINPKYVLDGCRNDLSLLQVDINKNGDKLQSIGDLDLSGLLKKNISSIYQLIRINQSSLLNVDVASIAVPNISTQFDSFAALDLGSSVNYTSLKSINISLDDTSSKTSNFSDSLSLTSFNPSWNNTAFIYSIEHFNADVYIENSTWISLNESTILSTIFDATVTISNSVLRSGFQSRWSVISAQANFKSAGNIQITNMQSNLTMVNVKLDYIQNVSVIELNTDMNLMIKNISLVLDYTNELKKQTSSMSVITDAIPQNLDLFILIVKQVLVDHVDSGLIKTIEPVVDALYSMTSCKSLISAVDDLVYSDICVNITTSLNGMWFCCLILGFCCCLGFIVGLKGQKRIGNFYKPIKVIPVYIGQRFIRL